MKTRTLISELQEKVGETVTVEGFVEKIRDQKAIQFVILRDITGKVQLVNEREKNAKFADIISSLPIESTIQVAGKVIENSQVKLGGLEIAIDELAVTSTAEPMLPIPVIGQEPIAPEKRMDYRWLDLRRSENLLIFKVQTTIERAMRDFWTKEKFLEIHSPKLMGAPSESGAELFEVKYFDRKAYLAQSPQFYKQMAMAAGFDKIFEIGPVFRADPSATSRHSTEFTGVDMEISYVESHHDVMDLEAKFLKHVLEVVKKEHGDEIKGLFNTEIEIPQLPFPEITMEEAQKIVAESGHKSEAAIKGDLDPEGERIVAKYIKEKEGHDFVFVTDYPASVRAFYHMRDENTGLTKSFDLLYKGVEITTGAQREHRYEILKKQAEEKGVSEESIKFYLEFFRYGVPPHGGLGLGLARLLMIMLNRENIREVTYLFRGMNRLEP
ncbi:TPA: aspartate--tRNA(Asn) ligase [Candidatus Berkelbacteria bacterium]|uniref:Aspartate--tRNA ligase n=1 Tax=Berkelbacteria bacterium GW2011_GWE1_39_12 TaxID=1618337 RepID=A0A0G4B2I0_9BACT|nr:MAG: aspartyl/asparaginyl-tRNA synthetase, aspartyl-tRNA synthetase [Berkelbacteria bacterium GW2011_GWE1_39_12]HBO60659.1 aspartate--tRNA(Asn) ligase [Candidatus Berkelbacteria bacterium]